ncbi:MAG: DinB family protein [Terracidiphilus sp.]
MPIDARIQPAAAIFRQNSGMLGRVLAGVSPEQWLSAPSDCCNPPLWILCHLVWTRSRLLSMLGVEWQRPWFGQFSRGAARPAADDYPAQAEVLAAWQESGPALAAALESATDELLSRPNNPPSLDETFAGMVSFLAVHETYHVGQMSYACRWLGLDRVFG